VRKLSVLFLLLVLIVPQAVFAQDSGSEGCQLLDGASLDATGAFGAVDFAAGDEISASSDDTSFDLTVNGAVVGSGALATAVTYTVASNASLTVGANITGTGTVEFGCGSEDDDDDDDGGSSGGSTEICHRPPGNPGNAHTITVGGGAVAAHLRHGDSEGACDEDEESRDEGDGGTITFSDEEGGVIGVYGACVGADCSEIATVNIDVIIEEWEEVGGMEPMTFILFDANPDDAWFVRVYYLGPSAPEDDNFETFQINIYFVASGDDSGDDDGEDGDDDEDDGDDDEGSATPVLQSDNLLIFIDFTTEIVTTDTQ